MRVPPATTFAAWKYVLFAFIHYSDVSFLYIAYNSLAIAFIEHFFWRCDGGFVLKCKIITTPTDSQLNILYIQMMNFKWPLWRLWTLSSRWACVTSRKPHRWPYLTLDLILFIVWRGQMVMIFIITKLKATLRL